MAAFNFVEIETECPVCRENTSVHIQIHIGASFQSGDKGRFCNKTYKIGDQLKWWDKDHAEFTIWTGSGLATKNSPNSVRECCYATCHAQGDRLYAVVEVSNLKIEKVVDLGPEEQWPAAYPK